MKVRNVVTKSVAVAVAFSLAFSMSAGIKAGAAKKNPKLNKSKLTLETGETFKLKVVKNKNKISKVTWKSTNADVVKVSKKGLVTALSGGDATIKAAFKVKKKKTTLKCKVSVLDNHVLAGGWEVPESPVVTDEVKALVNQFYESSVNGNKSKLTVTPYALLGTQVVNGTGYRVLCRVDLGADETGKEASSYSIVQIFADLSGNFVKEPSKLLAYTDDFASETVAVSGAGASIVGGYTQFDDPTISPENLAAFEKFYSDKNIPFPYKPIARLSYRESTGKREISLVCTRELASSGDNSTDEPVGYFIIKMETNEDTKEHTASSNMIFPISFVDTDYSVCVDKSMAAVDVETQAAWIRAYFIGASSGDTEAVKKIDSLVSYPVTVDGKEVKSADDFKALIAANKPSEDFTLAIRKAVCMQMFANSRGIMLGDGDHNLWLNQDQTDKKLLKITAINGLFSK